MNVTFKLLILLISFTSGSFLVTAQEKNPEILKSPKDWRFERINLPFDFAKNMKFKGYEELRFSPGMFDTESPSYFSYAFAASIQEQTKFKQEDILIFFNAYYKGLCAAVASGTDFDVDTSKITIEINKVKPRVKQSKMYHLKMHYFDTFTDGRAITLNIELELYRDKRAHSFYLLALVSPEKKGTEIWEQLYDIRTNTIIPLQKKKMT